MFGIHKTHIKNFVSEYLESKTGKTVGIFFPTFFFCRPNCVWNEGVCDYDIEKHLPFPIKPAFTDTHRCLTFPPSALLIIRESLFRECCFLFQTYFYNCNTLGTHLSVFKRAFKHTLLMYLIFLNIHKIWINSQADWIGSKLWSM